MAFFALKKKELWWEEEIKYEREKRLLFHILFFLSFFANDVSYLTVCMYVHTLYIYLPRRPLFSFLFSF